jgi:hypothetical protein
MVMLPISEGEDRTVGVVRAGDLCYDEYRDCVDGVTQRGYARFPA